MDFKNIQFKTDDIDKEQRVFKGYASTWDLDSGNDVIIKGAFANTLEKAASQVKVLWQHDSHQPIGRPTLMKEDDRGLYVEAKISNTAQGNDVLELMRDGVIDRMSIGYTVNESEYKDDGVRVIKDLNLFEFSAVTWPMNDAAIITGVKSQPKNAETILRDAGLSIKEAKTALSKIKGLRDVEPSSDELKAAKAAIDSMLITMKLNKG